MSWDRLNIGPFFLTHNRETEGHVNESPITTTRDLWKFITYYPAPNLFVVDFGSRKKRLEPAFQTLDEAVQARDAAMKRRLGKRKANNHEIR